MKRIFFLFTFTMILSFKIERLHHFYITGIVQLIRCLLDDLDLVAFDLGQPGQQFVLSIQL